MSLLGSCLMASCFVQFSSIKLLLYLQTDILRYYDNKRECKSFYFIAILEKYFQQTKYHFLGETVENSIT